MNQLEGLKQFTTVLPETGHWAAKLEHLMRAALP